MFNPRIEAEISELPPEWQTALRREFQTNPQCGVRCFQVIQRFQPSWTQYDDETCDRIVDLLANEEPAARTVSRASAYRTYSLSYQTVDRDSPNPALSGPDFSEVLVPAVFLALLFVVLMVAIL